MFSYTEKGKGLGLWKTMPTLRLRSMMSISSMEASSIVISPSILTPSTRSFILLKQRRSVDFPHPEGPMRDVIEFLYTWKSTFFSAWKGP